MSYRPMFNSKKREALWLRECLAAYQAGRSDGTFCICNLCDNPVFKTDAWDDSHDKGRAKAFGGKVTGVGHRDCNREHGAQVVTPAVAKSNRIRRKHIGAAGPGLGRHAMRGGKRDRISKTIGHGVVPRMTAAEKHARTMAARAIVPQQPEC